MRSRGFKLALARSVPDGSAATSASYADVRSIVTGSRPKALAASSASALSWGRLWTGKISPRTCSTPSALIERPRTVAESTPPDKPSTTPSAPARSTCSRIQAMIRSAKAMPALLSAADCHHRRRVRWTLPSSTRSASKHGMGQGGSQKDDARALAARQGEMSAVRKMSGSRGGYRFGARPAGEDGTLVIRSRVGARRELGRGAFDLNELYALLLGVGQGALLGKPGGALVGRVLALKQDRTRRITDYCHAQVMRCRPA